MYQFFTACDLKYAWWAVHLAKSIFVNSKNSNFTIFLINNSKLTNAQTKDVVSVFKSANSNVNIVWVKPEIALDEKSLPRYCAGFRTLVFGPDREKYFKKTDNLVWIDADSIVRSDLSSLENFCNSHNFDMAARPKNKKNKFASGLIVQKSTQQGIDFGNSWHSKWKERYKNLEWTADQNSFNDTVVSSYSFGIATTKGLPKRFCDVWITDEGVIWQAKHQTKMSKKYLNEMSEYTLPLKDSAFWDSLINDSIKTCIDKTEFVYRGHEFSMMGLSKEDIFEVIKDTNTFHNIEFLEALERVGNKDALISVGGGIQNYLVFLNRFTSPLLSVTFEPNLKMIDIGLRNSQNNWKDSGRHFGLFTNWTSHVLDELGRPRSSDASAIGPNVGIVRKNDGLNYRISAPDDLDFCTDKFLKNEKYKKVRKQTYAPETNSMVFKKREYCETNNVNPALFMNAYITSLDHACQSIYHQAAHPGSEICRIVKDYDFKKLIGMIVIDVYDSSLEIIQTGQAAIQNFKPHVGIVVYKKNKLDRINKIERLLGKEYKLVFEGPHQLENDATCLVYKSLRRENE
ncbi:hypothetical protein OAA09_00290 [bacterium]|nr:hypothetical protein [bacterium]